MTDQNSPKIGNNTPAPDILLPNFGDLRLLHIFEDAALPIGVCDREGNFLYFNAAYADLIGYTLEELYQTNFEAIVYPEDLASNADLIGELAQGQRNSFDVVNRYVHKNGQPIWVHKYIFILRDGAGRATHLIGLVTDVSDRKQTELQLKENQERLRAILDNAADAIITINKDGIIEGVNRASLTMFGYQEDELLGQKINRLMPPPYCDEHDQYIAQYLQTGEKKVIGIGQELIARRKDGSLFPIELTVTEVDHMQMFTGFVRDITTLKREHERVLKSERLAGLGEAMAALVHENRNALSRIQANLRMLSRRIGDRDELLKLIDGALTASEDLGRQYEEVREYAAPIRLKCTTVKLKDLVDEAWGQLSAAREGRNTTLRMTFNNADSSCLADRFKLINAFRNILENALTATENDPVLIDVEFVGTEMDDAPAVQLRFRDYGTGLSSEVSDSVLEAFVTTKTRGTGLGLAIVKRIVEAHGGMITIDSVNPEGGTGTIVSVTVPSTE